MGLNPATDWERARPIAEAVLATVADVLTFGHYTTETVTIPVGREVVKERVANQSNVAESVRALNEPYAAAGRAALQTLTHDTATTSPDVAAIASRGLVNPESLTPDEIQSVCGSALMQVRG